MKKIKSYINYFLIPIIILAFILQAYFLSASNQRYLDNLFINAIANSSLGFGMNYSIMSDEEKNYYYIEIASNLKVASSLILKTSYKKNKSLYDSINNIYLCMTNNVSRDLILNQNYDIYKLLISISENPYNLQASEKLQQITKDICLKEK